MTLFCKCGRDITEREVCSEHKYPKDGHTGSSDHLYYLPLTQQKRIILEYITGPYLDGINKEYAIERVLMKRKPYKDWNDAIKSISKRESKV